ncbi:hypothetical protein NLI96_g6822 [Meripilus lineatus]|uniref:Uncharacterized protein n=1 Tax=Meripilus lineatus TaxID=2056292 RepID=A0AAD5V075_9APHY|nr:hypothetical protein NLI96_g6822 [Physisporinus lineatus]
MQIRTSEPAEWMEFGGIHGSTHSGPQIDPPRPSTRSPPEFHPTKRVGLGSSPSGHSFVTVWTGVTPTEISNPITRGDHSVAEAV